MLSHSTPLLGGPIEGGGGPIEEPYINIVIIIGANATTTLRRTWPAPWYKAAGSRSSGCLTSCSTQAQRQKTTDTPGLAALPPSQHSVGDGPRQCNESGPSPPRRLPPPSPSPRSPFFFFFFFFVYLFLMLFPLHSSFRVWARPT